MPGDAKWSMKILKAFYDIISIEVPFLIKCSKMRCHAGSSSQTPQKRLTMFSQIIYSKGTPCSAAFMVWLVLLVD